MSKVNQMKKDVEKDIKKIKDVLVTNNADEMLRIHKYIDSKYQSRIDKWGLSQNGWSNDWGFDYDFIGANSISENLENMIGKLEGYIKNLDIIFYDAFNNKSNKNNVNIYNANNNINNNKNTIDFQVIENNILNNETMNEEETKEAIKYLEELKKIYESKDTRKSKWEKSKKIIMWLLDKGVDIAIAYLPTIVSMISK